MKEYELVSDEISGTENEGNNGNREYKDSLFCFIFGHECRRHFTLELYNAVNGTNYTDPNEISFTTDSVIKPVLEESRAEVINLCITEYTQEYADKIQKKEIDEYKETISVLKDDNANLRNDNVSLKSENACLKNDIIEKDTEIATLKALLASKQIKY